MWKLHVNATVDVWANATEYTARRTFDVLGLDYDIPIKVNEAKDVQTFTYMFAITELWEAKNLPGTALPRTAAILLIIFSGLWPHLKLIMLNLTWFFGKHKMRRTTTLSWLAALGSTFLLLACLLVSFVRSFVRSCCHCYGYLIQSVSMRAVHLKYFFSLFICFQYHYLYYISINHYVVKLRSRMEFG